ncbi:MAG TPA: transcription antitermination factor NusB [Vicinamibacterales bacterium]
MISPARWAAFEALRRADPGRGGGKDLASALAETRGLASDHRDRALATEISLGVERWRAALDATIAAAAGRSIDAVDFPALLALRIAVFQITHLTRTPAHAVVDDAVETTRRAGAPRAAGFVNAVLRRLLRGPLDAGLPPRPDDEDEGAWVRYLSITLSHPAWLVARWMARHGARAAEQWASFNNAAAALTVRVNTTRITVERAQADMAAEGVATEPAAHAPRALVATAGNPMSTSLYRDGLVALMDETSQLVGALAASSLSGTVLDACASPGGKTLVLACDMPAGSRLIAADRRPRRVNLLRRSLGRYGLTRVPVVQHDLARGVPFDGLDGVLVDAPCSGLGTIRRDPDIRWRRSEADLAPLAAMQRTLLQHAAAAVGPGGRVVYATCSSEPEENEDVVDAFLAAHGGFARAAIAGAPFAAFTDARGDFRTLPHRDGLEAFYAAVLTRGL